MTNQKNLPATQAPKTLEDLRELMQPVSARYDQQKVLQNAALVAFELEKIGARMIFGWAMMDQTEDGKSLKQGISQDWVDVLGDFPIAEVKRGIGDCLEANPKQAPHEHAVKAAINARRAKAMLSAPRAPKPQEPERTQLTEAEMKERQERSKQIMREIFGAGNKEGETSGAD